MISDIDLQDEIISKVRPIISSWMDHDIYAISFYVYDKQDNPCEPTFTLGYNTERDYQKALTVGNDYVLPADESEARWNYAFWSMNNFLVFGDGETAEIVKQWIVDSGFPYLTHEDFFYKEMSDKEFDILCEKCETITRQFIKILICVVKRLHESEFIQDKLGRKIPIIIHELEYYDEIAEQNIEANGLQLVQEFIDFTEYPSE